MYQLTIMRRYPNGTIVMNKQDFDTFLAASRTQSAVMAVAERDNRAIATTLIEHGKRHEPKVSSAYQAIQENLAA